ncbi:MAG: beta-galactosidase [Rikenellaceae bacterium]
MKKITLLILALLVAVNVASAESMRQRAQTKIGELEKVIERAKVKKINTLKEEAALRMAETFMIYADWDEKNKDHTASEFKKVYAYKKEPQIYADLLPNFEREEIVKMMQSSIEELESVMSGKIKRLPTPNIDWSKTKLEGDQVSYEGKPVFLTDWTWKPDVAAYEEYFGQLDGFFLTGSYLLNEKGDINPRIIKDLDEKGEGTMGFIFFNHNGFPKWAIDKDPAITQGKGEPYVSYDINNPLAREVYSKMIQATVPKMAGKQFTKLGYMICNEPRWVVTKDAWYADSFSDLTYADFLKWLEAKHKTIVELNKVWGTSFASFDKIEAPRYMTDKQRGSNLYFDFMRYNMDRVNDWVEFMRDEVQKADPGAKTHLKTMPDQWSASRRDHGMDLERLTELTEIIGNDARTCGIRFNKPDPYWAKNYSFNWEEICMGYDFLKSISPEKIVFNTESHLLTVGAYRNLYETKEYVRINYWTAHIHGLTATQSWYWNRKEDGSTKSSKGNGYAGSNNHQPRVMNEVHATTFDLNSVSDEIMKFQRQRKPIRLFYTEASAISEKEYMENVFKSYEKVCFDGYSVGFATQNIINKQDNKLWDVVMVAATPRVFVDDLKALQSYLDNGGTVVLDQASLMSDEYGRKLPFELKQSKGKLIKVASAKEAAAKALEVASQGENAPAIVLADKNGLKQKGAIWKVVDGQSGAKIINIANLSRNSTKITLTWADGKPIKSITNVLTGEKLKPTFEMPVFGVVLLECE